MEGEWLIRPGESVGSILASSTADDLRRAFGDDALLIDPDLATGTGLIPRDDPGSMLDITWRDPKRRVGVASVRAAYGKFQWRTYHGLHHGMPLAEVARTNGGELLVGKGGEVVGPAGQLAELGRTLFLTFKGAPSSSPEAMVIDRSSDEADRGFAPARRATCLAGPTLVHALSPTR
jgi:hypothetical protein